MVERSENYLVKPSLLEALSAEACSGKYSKGLEAYRLFQRQKILEEKVSENPTIPILFGIPGVNSRIMTAKSFADLPDAIFCNITECLDWGEMGKIISYSKIQVQSGHIPRD